MSDFFEAIWLLLITYVDHSGNLETMGRLTH